MNGIILHYKKPEWSNWCTWHCKDRAEADKIRGDLKAEGYQVRG